MEGISSRGFGFWGCCKRGDEPRPDEGTEMRPLNRPDPESYSGQLEAVMSAHHRPRSGTVLEVLQLRYDSPWDTDETMRQALRTGPDFLKRTGLPFKAFVCPGRRALPEQLLSIYEEVLRHFIRIGIDFCALKRIQLEVAYRELLSLQQNLHELRGDQKDSGFEGAFHRLASMYLRGLADAQVRKNELVAELETLRSKGVSLVNFCPIDAPHASLPNLPNVLHMLAHNASFQLFDGRYEQVYCGVRGEGGFYEPEGLLRSHEVQHPGSTAAAYAAMTLVAEKLGEPQPSPITLQWLDLVRSTLASHMDMSRAHPLGGPPGSGAYGGVPAVRIKGELAAYAAAIDAHLPGDNRPVYMAISAFCHGMLSWLPYEEDWKLTALVAMQYLLLSNGLPTVPEQAESLLEGSIQKTALRLETFGTSQRATVAEFPYHYFSQMPDEVFAPPGRRRTTP